MLRYFLQQDPKGNKIDQWRDQTLVSGVFNESLKLSTEPILGLWEIKVESYGQESTKQFEVAEYVLPKFEVSVKLPSFYVTDNSKTFEENNKINEDLIFHVSAKYDHP